MFDEEIASITVAALKSRPSKAAAGPAPPGAGSDAPPSPRAAAAAAAKDDPATLTAEDADHVAMAIAHTAHSYAQNPYKRTPWSVAAAETGMPWARFFVKGGGKMDDVTVVVAFIRAL